MTIYEAYGGRQIEAHTAYACLRIEADMYIRIQFFDGYILRFYILRPDVWEATESFHTERGAHETV